MKVNIQLQSSVLAVLAAKLESAKLKGAYVGIPSEADEPVEDGEGFNLASLAAVLEFGNERIPSRPFLRQTLAENKEKYTALFSQLFKQGVEISQIYEQIALMAQGDVQLNIDEGNWIANAQSTIKRKKSSKPLIDIGILRQSIVGVVRDEN
ncbi:hypothetical protein [Haemophilus sputorum]|uniref:hypothetical protein n=1 Tax=Haemophilus sputorum TaxID=1078480 RepID=UPI0028D54E81|nr:hypothetical protein [Haemophilus sputorum]